MPTTDRIRYTVMVTGNDGPPALFGAFHERDTADAMAASWHRLLNAARDPGHPDFLMVEVVIIDAPTAGRRRHWFGR